MFTETFQIKLLKDDYLSNFHFEEQGGTRRHWCPDSSLYLRSQWEQDQELPSANYLAYRWAHVVVLLLCLIVSLASCPTNYALKCYIYMTTWASCFHLYQALLGASVVTMGLRCGSVPARLRSLYRAHHATSVALALGVTFVYWIFIYEGLSLTVGKVASHGINSAVMLLDLLLVAHPVFLSDIVYPLAFGFLYTLFTLMYHAYGGTNAKGNPYVYKILDWNSPKDALSFAVIGMCILISMFLFVLFVSKLRRSVARKLKPPHVVVHI